MKALKRLLKALLWPSAALLLVLFLEAMEASPLTQLSVLGAVIALAFNYEIGTAKDRMADLEFRLDLLERDLRDRNLLD